MNCGVLILYTNEENQTWMHHTLKKCGLKDAIATTNITECFFSCHSSVTINDVFILVSPAAKLDAHIKLTELKIGNFTG